MQLPRRAVLSTLAPLLAAPLLAAPRAAIAEEQLATAYFSAGDARFMQPNFDELKYLGVKRSEVGSLGSTPAIRVTYDANKIPYKKVLGAFWRSCDPTREAQFGQPVPSIVWIDGEEEQKVAAESKRRLQKATEYNIDPRNPPMYKGKPILTEIRPLVADTAWAPAPDEEQDWYKKEEKAYEKARQKTGRAKYFDDAFKPVTVTACQTIQGEGTVCGFVYFPCGDANGCTAVTRGTF